MTSATVVDIRPTRVLMRGTILAATSFVAAFLVALAIHAVTGDGIRHHPDDLGIGETIVGLTLAPLIENLLLVLVVEALVAARVTKRLILPLLSALPLAAMHSALDPAWGFGVYPAFVVFAYAYDHYRRGGEATTGYWASVFVHALHNAIAMTVIVIATG